MLNSYEELCITILTTGQSGRRRKDKKGIILLSQKLQNLFFHGQLENMTPHVTFQEGKLTGQSYVNKKYNPFIAAYEINQ